ncbi:hypothetical protein ACFQQB_29615 [Nonomuraea rubra]|uniref:hypothetical protein n=1 Tax=Nonomuraea rubra TaxID=46180 RepID=UPI00360DF5A8
MNLHEPGTVRALLDEAVRRGWDGDDPRTVCLDGWDLFTAAATRITTAATGVTAPATRITATATRITSTAPSPPSAE